MNVLKKLFILLVALGSCIAFGHGSRKDHYNDVARILNGFGTPDYDDAAKYHQVVASNGFSPNATPSTIQSQTAFSDFFVLFEEVSSKMDSMPRDLEIKYGLKRFTLSHPKTHRFLCHGWPLGQEPGEATLKIFEMKTGLSRTELLNYWRDYQAKVFLLAEQCTKLPPEKAKAFACLIWDIHLLGDWTPDNSAVTWLVSIDDITDDICKNLTELLGEEDAKKICDELKKLVKARKAEGRLDREIAEEAIEWLSEKKIGTRVYKTNKESMNGRWNHNVAENINESNATLKSKKNVREAAAKKEKVRKSRAAKKKPAAKAKVNENPKTTASNVKSQCKKAKITKGKIPKSMNPVDAYLVSFKSRAGQKGLALIFNSSAVKVGAIEGVSAFVMSSGMAIMLHGKGFMDKDEMYNEIIKSGFSSLTVGSISAVAVALGATPTGWVVLAIGIGGYVVCDFVFDLIKPTALTVDDILGYMDEEFETTLSFLEFNDKMPNKSVLDAPKKDSFIDTPSNPSFIDFDKSKNKSFLDFF